LANLQLKYVTDLGDEQAMNVETAVSDADKGTDWLVGGDFYFDHAWSLGAAVEKKNAIDYYTLRTRYFFDSSFSGDLSYVDTSDKTEGTRITARLTLRF
jgi:hypothetical protein